MTNIATFTERTVTKRKPRKINVYTQNAIDGLIKDYTTNHDGKTYEGEDFIVCYGKGLRTCVLKPYEIDDKVVGYTARFYNVMPKKYEKMIYVNYCKYCGNPTNNVDEDVLCKDCRDMFGHTFYSEL